MRQIINNFPKQFSFKPVIKNAKNLPQEIKKIVVGGMGGSHLAADLLKTWKPDLDIQIHSDYGLPLDFEKSFSKKTLFIASSYSGETEETIDFLNKAIKNKFFTAAIGTGGRLIQIAEKNNLPYIVFPKDALQPRLAVGYSFKSFLKIIKDSKGLIESEKLVNLLKPIKYEEKGKKIAEKLKKALVIGIYASRVNKGLALNWKVKLNENAKTPAYFQLFPELNHNEMAGFETKNLLLTNRFYFVIIKDRFDNPKILKRITVLSRIYQKNNLKIIMVELEGKGLLKIFSNVVLADWVSYYLALKHNVNPLTNQTVEKFKKLII